MSKRTMGLRNRGVKWDFKTAQIQPDGRVKLVDLSEKQKTRVKKYTEALETAKDSIVANPFFSNYFVKEGIGLAHGKMLPAGNIEYGFCQALHGEESAVSTFRSHYGRDNPDEIILGIITGSLGGIVTPCGNCRDIMLDDLGKDFEIVSGTVDGGIAVVVSMNHYLFSEFKKLNITDISSYLLLDIGNTVKYGEILCNDAYSPKDIHPERKYHALINTDDNQFFGAHDVMCDYHPIYALRDAIRQARRYHDPFVKSVVIVSKDSGGKAPHVMYKDRQHLMELNLQAELMMNQENDPPVFLVTHDDEKIVNAWQTSVKEWIPSVFTPRNFGPEFVEYLTDYFQGPRDFDPLLKK